MKKNYDLGKTWLFSFNPKKTESLLISHKLNKPGPQPLFMYNQVIIEVEFHKHIGVFLSNDFRGISILITSRKKPGVE